MVVVVVVVAGGAVDLAFSDATTDPVAAAEHVGTSGSDLVSGLAVGTGGAGVLTVGAKSMGPAVAHGTRVWVSRSWSVVAVAVGFSGNEGLMDGQAS